MYCKRCGSVLGEDLVCPKCGLKNCLDKGLRVNRNSSIRAKSHEQVNVYEQNIVQSQEEVQEHVKLQEQVKPQEEVKKIEQVKSQNHGENDNTAKRMLSDKYSYQKNKLWAWLSGLMFAISTIPLYKGYDKMTNYYSSETYSRLNVNAYVGGDAYNYIINAGYATAFFVLAIGAALLGVGFLIVYYLSDKKVN